MRSTAPDHVVRRYLRGGCFDLAIELAKVTKLPLWGLRLGGSGELHHAFVADPETGFAYDVRGRLKISDVADGAIDGLIPGPATEDEVLSNIGGSPDPGEAREARRVIREHIPGLPKAKARREPEILDDARREAMRRGEIAAGVFGWTEERLAAFRKEAATFVPIEGAEIDPEDFGLPEDDAFSPGPEKRMSPELRVALGRYDAAKAVASWCVTRDVEISQERAEKYATDYLDRFESEAMSAEDVRVEDFDVSDMDRLYEEGQEGGVEGWLRRENRNSIADGMAGYADLLLERMREPCVYRSYDDGTADIADGWHRTAAAIVAGQGSMRAVVVPLPAPERGDFPSP